MVTARFLVGTDSDDAAIRIEEKLRAGMQSGTVEPIAQKDLLNASGKHKATTREWFTTARNYALYANESGLYDEILKYTK